MSITSRDRSERLRREPQPPTPGEAFRSTVGHREAVSRPQLTAPPAQARPLPGTLPILTAHAPGLKPPR